MNRAVFITGAQMGTGFRIAETFAENGWNVFITSRRGEEAKRAAEDLAARYGIFAKGYECNIRSEEQVKEIFKDIDETGYPVMGKPIGSNVQISPPSGERK